MSGLGDGMRSKKEAVLSAMWKLGHISENDYYRREHKLGIRLAVEAAPPLDDYTIQELRRLFRVGRG